MYLVGGAVRDLVMGVTPKDCDYVVVGATPDDMLRLGFSQVGASFPVFLHPQTGDEYALARTERKTGVGYHGFDVSADQTVTLEEDLSRRDLTMNAMAIELEGLHSDNTTGSIIDPFGGQHDINCRIIRHTTSAFAEDPVRVLRAARFAARYGFAVHKDTMALMTEVSSELAYVTQERIWAEFEKGLMESYPEKMIEVLRQCGAMELQALQPYSRTCASVFERIKPTDQLAVRFAVASYDFKPVDYERYKIPTWEAKVSNMLIAHGGAIRVWDDLTAADKVRIFTATRSINDTKLLDAICRAVVILTGVEVSPTIVKDLTTVRNVDAQSIAASGVPNVGAAINQARVAALTL